jgi:hypothetical protein
MKQLSVAVETAQCREISGEEIPVTWPDSGQVIVPWVGSVRNPENCLNCFRVLQSNKSSDPITICRGGCCTMGGSVLKNCTTKMFQHVLIFVRYKQVLQRNKKIDKNNY